MKVKWEYCECGCKGSQCSDYWMHNDLKGQFYLFDGHGFMGERIGIFKSQKALDEAVIPLLRKKIKSLKDLIGETEDLLGK